MVNPLWFHFDTLRTQYKRYDRKLPRSTQPTLAFATDNPNEPLL